MPFEYGGQTWPDSPWVIRDRQVRLQHVTPDVLDGYECRWPDGLALTTNRTAHVTIPGIDPVTGVFPKDASGVHAGTITMHLVPGQPADGPMSCRAWVQIPRLTTRKEWTDWEAANPGETPLRVYSEWSNSLPLGPTLPDPVPEPGLVAALLLGVVGLWVVGWRRRTR